MAEWAQAEKSENKLASTLTNLLGIYFSFAMWQKFELALTDFLGASLAIIIATLVFLCYQIIKIDQKNESDAGYQKNPYISYLKDENGIYQALNTNTADNNKSTLMTIATFVFIIWLSEMTWSNIFL